MKTEPFLYFLSFLLLVFTSSCQEHSADESAKTYTKCDTTVNKILGFETDRVCTMYYSGGEVKYVESFKDSLRQGPVINFYKNGNVKDSCLWLNGYRVGDMKYYNKSGVLVKKQQWIVYEGEHKHVNHYYVYDNGKIDTSRSNFIDLKVDRSKTKDCYFLDIKYYSPFKEDSVKFIFGRLDESTGMFFQKSCMKDTTFPKRQNYKLCYPCLDISEPGEIGIKLFEFSGNDTTASGRILIKPFLIKFK